MIDVLLVEDEDGIREALAAFLSLRGYRVRSAGTVDEALAIVAQEPAACLVSDERLGPHSGTTVVEAYLRRNPRACAAITTANAHSTLQGFLSQHPTVSCLLKPLSPRGLAAWVQEQLERADDSGNSDSRLGRPADFEACLASSSLSCEDGWIDHDLAERWRARARNAWSSLGAAVLLDLRWEAQWLSIFLSTERDPERMSLPSGCDLWSLDTAGRCVLRVYRPGIRSLPMSARSMLWTLGESSS